MATELPKTYDPTAIEAEAFRVWIDEKAYHAEASDAGEPYCIVIPPPNVTGALHLGHAINNTLQDILTRVHRMRGFNALWMPGIDHAGIATQAVVEKQLKENENKTRHDVGRDCLVERIWKWKEQYGDRIISQLKRLGCSCDWDRTRFTLDEMCARAVRETFFKLFKDGLIYRGKRLVNWDVFLQTSISDDEIYHETVKTNLWHIKYPIVDSPSPGTPGEGRGEGTQHSALSTQHFLSVATTRPETMLGDTAVAVHPDDPRWNWAIGKFVELPLTGRKIPIIGDAILVNMEFGSGCVKVTPAHDPNDYAVWQRQAGKIDIINILTPDGKINEAGGPYAGLKREVARKKIVEDLVAQGLLEKEEPYETQVGHSDRSKTPVEPYLSDQWFVKMAPLAESALEVVRDGTIKFFPERHAQQYLSWLGEKRDWPISRQLWWGHRIPVWTQRVQITWERRDYRNKVLPLIAGFHHGRRGYVWLSNVTTGERHRPEDFEGVRPDLDGTYEIQLCLREDLEPDDDGMIDWADVIQRQGFVQDPDVLDTWFSSALWPHSTLGWPDDTPELRKWYPTSVLLTDRGIITLWVARMVMMGMYNMQGHSAYQSRFTTENTETTENEKLKKNSSSVLSVNSVVNNPPAVPFRHVVINPTILDGKGERMSKSKGNGVDPVDIIETHGADALRFTLVQMATETQDVRIPVKKLPDGRNTSDKFDVGRNFCNKLWNAARFVLSSVGSALRTASPSDAPDGPQCGPYIPPDESTWSLADRWIVSRFNRTVEEANTALATYRFDAYARVCYDFFWRDFCDWYVEAIKPALKDPTRATQTAQILASVLDGSLRLMHPMIPFITETIWWHLNEIAPQRGLPGRIECKPSQRLIKASWPTVGDFSQASEHIFPKIQEVIGAIRNIRNEYKVDQKKRVEVSISAPPEPQRQIESNREMIELLATCNIKQLLTPSPHHPTPPSSSAARATAAGCEIFVEGLIDANAEQQRLGKRRDDLNRQIAALRGRLSSESYTAKAPPHLVKQTQDQLAEAEAELAKLG